jgi:hypothetical protein
VKINISLIFLTVFSITITRLALPFSITNLAVFVIKVLLIMKNTIAKINNMKKNARANSDTKSTSIDINGNVVYKL